jgi:hypothetical protein
MEGFQNGSGENFVPFLEMVFVSPGIVSHVTKEGGSEGA